MAIFMFMDNGIIEKAILAKRVYEEQSEKEIELLNNSSNVINQYVNSKKEATINDYVTSGLILHYDGIENTRNGNDPNATSWEDLSGNENDGIFYGINTNSDSITDSDTGYYNKQEKGYVLLGHDSYIQSKNNLGITGDALFTIEIVCNPWSDGRSSISGPETIDLIDYGTVANELEDQGRNLHIKLNRYTGDVEYEMVNMGLKYKVLGYSPDKPLSVAMRKDSGVLDTENFDKFNILENNLSLKGKYFIYDPARNKFCYL